MPECFITQWQRSGVIRGYASCAGQEECVNLNSKCNIVKSANVQSSTYKVTTKLCNRIVKYFSDMLSQTHLWAEVEGLEDETTNHV